MGDDRVDQAIQRLASQSATLTLDQRLRIAALLAQPAEPEATRDRPTPTGDPAAALVLTVEETAEILKVGRTTVYDLIRNDRLSSIMIGRLRRIRYADVLVYLDLTATQPTPPVPAGADCEASISSR